MTLEIYNSTPTAAVIAGGGRLRGGPSTGNGGKKISKQYYATV